MIIIKKLTIIGLILVFFYSLFANTNIFNFIENISGKRDFYVFSNILFDVYNIDGENLKSNITLEATVINFEKFYIKIFNPEFLKNIEIKLDVLTTLSYFTYDNYKVVDSDNLNIDSIYEILETISSFLSSSLFNIFETNNNLTLIPTGAPFLKRLGIEPTKISVSFDNNSIKQITFSTDDSTETISIIFKKFKIINSIY